MTAWKDRALFLRAWLRKPGQVGSVTPSAPALVDRMLKRIPWDRVRTVAELGAGTGPITAKVCEQKPARVRFLVFEREPEFRRLLKQRFPQLEMYPEAAQLSRVLERTGLHQADVILSGIPFAALPAQTQESLLDEIERSLAPGGLFVAFQYSWLLYRRLRRRFSRVDLGFTLFNLPPAVVYYCYKAEAHQPAAAPVIYGHGH